MRFIQVLSILGLAAQGVVSRDEWKNCNACMVSETAVTRTEAPYLSERSFVLVFENWADSGVPRTIGQMYQLQGKPRQGALQESLGRLVRVPVSGVPRCRGGMCKGRVRQEVRVSDSVAPFPLSLSSHVFVTDRASAGNTATSGRYTDRSATKSRSSGTMPYHPPQAAMLVIFSAARRRMRRVLLL